MSIDPLAELQDEDYRRDRSKVRIRETGPADEARDDAASKADYEVATMNNRYGELETATDTGE